LDEPLQDFIFEDIRVLMEVLNVLVDKGKYHLVIEHNMDVIKMADYLIDIGYEGGKSWRHGKLRKVSPEQLSKDKKSYTASF